MVRVLMPAAPGRPYQVDLLLCGHHFRLSQWTLAAAGAVARVIPGRLAVEVVQTGPALAARDQWPAEKRVGGLPFGPTGGAPGIPG